MPHARNVVVLLVNPEGQKMIKESCKESGLLFDVFQELVQVEVEQTGKLRSSGLWNLFDKILDRIQADDKANVS